MQAAMTMETSWKSRREIETVLLANRCMMISRMNLATLFMLSMLFLTMIVYLTATSAPLQKMIIDAWIPVVDFVKPATYRVVIHPVAYNVCEFGMLSDFFS